MTGILPLLLGSQLLSGKQRRLVVKDLQRSPRTTEEEKERKRTSRKLARGGYLFQHSCRLQARAPSTHCWIWLSTLIWNRMVLGRLDHPAANYGNDSAIADDFVGAGGWKTLFDQVSVPLSYQYGVLALSLNTAGFQNCGMGGTCGLEARVLPLHTKLLHLS